MSAIIFGPMPKPAEDCEKEESTNASSTESANEELSLAHESALAAAASSSSVAKDHLSVFAVCPLRASPLVQMSASERIKAFCNEGGPVSCVVGEGSLTHTPRLPSFHFSSPHPEPHTLCLNTLPPSPSPLSSSSPLPGVGTSSAPRACAPCTTANCAGSARRPSLRATAAAAAAAAIAPTSRSFTAAAAAAAAAAGVVRPLLPLSLSPPPHPPPPPPVPRAKARRGARARAPSRRPPPPRARARERG